MGLSTDFHVGRFTRKKGRQAVPDGGGKGCRTPFERSVAIGAGAQTFGVRPWPWAQRPWRTTRVSCTRAELGRNARQYGVCVGDSTAGLMRRIGNVAPFSGLFRVDGRWLATRESTKGEVPQWGFERKCSPASEKCSHCSKTKALSAQSHPCGAHRAVPAVLGIRRRRLRAQPGTSRQHAAAAGIISFG